MIYHVILSKWSYHPLSRWVQSHHHQNLKRFCFWASRLLNWISILSCNIFSNFSSSKAIFLLFYDKIFLWSLILWFLHLISSHLDLPSHLITISSSHLPSHLWSSHLTIYHLIIKTSIDKFHILFFSSLLSYFHSKIVSSLYLKMISSYKIKKMIKWRDMRWLMVKLNYFIILPSWMI